MMRSSSSVADTWLPLTLIRSCRNFQQLTHVRGKGYKTPKGKPAATTHLQSINNKNPTIFANEPKIARLQPPIGSKQVSRSGDIVIIAHRRHWPFDVDLARRGRRQGTAVLGRDDLGDGAGV
jgi:hypothetical protein